MKRQTIRVPNISCGHCVRTIEREVGDLEGVAAVDVQQGDRTVTVEWREEETSWDEIDALLREINYPPE